MPCDADADVCRLSLRMTTLFHYVRARIGRLFFVGVDFAIVFGVEGAVLGIELFGGHGENEAVFLAFKAGGVVAAVGIDHALGERAGVDEFGERSGEVAVLLVELALGAENDAHVGESGGFRVGAGGVAGEFRLVGGGRGLSGRGRNLRERREDDEYPGGDYRKRTKGPFFYA